MIRTRGRQEGKIFFVFRIDAVLFDFVHETAASAFYILGYIFGHKFTVSYPLIFTAPKLLSVIFELVQPLDLRGNDLVRLGQILTTSLRQAVLFVEGLLLARRPGMGV
jgi:hypothetical protein